MSKRFDAAACSLFSLFNLIPAGIATKNLSTLHHLSDLKAYEDDLPWFESL